jgi:hypothetical protein
MISQKFSSNFLNISVAAVSTILAALGTLTTAANAAEFAVQGTVKDFIYVKSGNGPNAPTGLEVGDLIKLNYNLSSIPTSLYSDFEFEIDSYSLTIDDTTLTGTPSSGAGNLDGTFEISLLHGDTDFFVDDPLGIEDRIPVDFLIGSLSQPNSREIDFVVNGFVNDLDDTDTCNLDPGNPTFRCFEGSWFSAGVKAADSLSNPDSRTVPEPGAGLGLGILSGAWLLTRKMKF